LLLSTDLNALAIDHQSSSRSIPKMNDITPKNRKKNDSPMLPRTLNPAPPPDYVSLGSSEDISPSKRSGWIIPEENTGDCWDLTPTTPITTPTMRQVTSTDLNKYCSIKIKKPAQTPLRLLRRDTKAHFNKN
jgi:hypothetical protein